MSRTSSVPPPWYGQKPVKVNGFNPRLAKHLEALDANRDALTRAVKRLREANDEREAKAKAKK